MFNGQNIKNIFFVIEYYYKHYNPKFFGVFCCGFASAWYGGNIEGGPGPGY